MTIASETNRSGPYLCNGSTTVFPYAFQVSDASHLRVVRTNSAGLSTDLTLGTDYTVSGVGSSGGGSITTTVAYASGNTIVNLLSLPFTQEIDLTNQGGYYAETVETGFDLAVQRDLQLKEEIDRCIKVPADFEAADLEALTGAILRVSDSADAIDAVSDIVGSIPAVAAISDDIELIAGIAEVISGTASALLVTEDVFTGNGVATTFALARAPGSSANVLLMVGGVPQSLADYSVSGTTLTISPAVANGVPVVARLTTALTANELAVYRDQAQAAAAAAEAAADAAEAVPIGHAILYDAQSLDDTKKAQARANIGAVAASDLAAVAASGDYADLSGKPTLGTAAALDVGDTADKVVQLNGSAKIPTSLLDTGTGANQVPALDASGRYPAADGSLITGISGLGVGQTWQSVTRSSGGTYQNTTGKPIVVSAILSANETYITGSISVSQNNSTWIDVGIVSNLEAGHSVTITEIVPNNWYYRVTSGAGSQTVFELR